MDLIDADWLRLTPTETEEVTETVLEERNRPQATEHDRRRPKLAGAIETDGGQAKPTEGCRKLTKVNRIRPEASATDQRSPKSNEGDRSRPEAIETDLKAKDTGSRLLKQTTGDQNGCTGGDRNRPEATEPNVSIS